MCPPKFFIHYIILSASLPPPQLLGPRYAACVQLVLEKFRNSVDFSCGFFNALAYTKHAFFLTTRLIHTNVNQDNCVEYSPHSRETIDNVILENNYLKYFRGVRMISIEILRSFPYCFNQSHKRISGSGFRKFAVVFKHASIDLILMSFWVSEMLSYSYVSPYQ